MFRHPKEEPASREETTSPEGGSKEVLGRHFASLADGIVVVKNALQNLLN
jgi:hypothetical protein